MCAELIAVGGMRRRRRVRNPVPWRAALALIVLSLLASALLAGNGGSGGVANRFAGARDELACDYGPGPDTLPPRPLFAVFEDPLAFTALVEGYPGRPRNDIRAIYLTGSSAGNDATMGRVFALVAESELNALVVDVKDNTGRTTYPSQLAAVRDLGAATNRLPDLAAWVRECDARGVYTIARLVVFADPVLALARPDLSVQNETGGVWRDAGGQGWTNPYAEEVWRYNLAIAQEVASLGVREIQFDYVRFPSDGRMDLVRYPIRTDQRPAEVIESFLSTARVALAPYGVFIGADVFGLVTSVRSDMSIGQVLESIARQVDFVCPMMYPSHYAPGSYGITEPNAEPYLTVRTGLQDALTRLDGWPNVLIRPWLQDFSWGRSYGPAEVLAQIRAARELGVKGYMLWNANNVYTEQAIR